MAAALGLDNKIWASLRKEYKLGRISEIEEIEGASSTVQYKLESAGKKLVLRLEDERSANNLESELDVLVFLRKHNFPCPRPIAAKDGDFLKPVDNKSACLFRKIAGKVVPLTELDNEQIFKIGQTVARLHVLGQAYDQFVVDRFSFELVRRTYKNLRVRIADHLKHVLHVLDDEIAHQNEYREEKLPNGLVHGNPVPGNFLFRGGKVVGVLNFDSMCSGKFTADLANMVNTFCYMEEHYEIERFNSLLNGYQTERTLSLAEWDAFPNELRFSAFHLIIKQLENVFFRHLDEKRRINSDYVEYFDRLRILRRERSGGMDQMLLTMATGYDYRKYQKIQVEEKAVTV